jgi:hypothetical protein
MRRTTLNFLVDSLAFVDLLLLAATGVIMKWVLPPGTGGGYGRGFRGGRPPVEAKDLFGLARHDWGAVHFVLALLFVLLIVVHTTLHWTWIKTCGKSLLFPSPRIPCDPADEPDVQ